MTKPPKVTTEVLRAMKQAGEPIAALTAYDHLWAGLLDAAGVDVLLVCHHQQQVRMRLANLRTAAGRQRRGPACLQETSTIEISHFAASLSAP